MKVGWEVGFLSGRTSEEVAARARELGIEIVVQGSRDKVEDFEKILKDRNLQASEVVYMGDDLPDLLCCSGRIFCRAWQRRGIRKECCSLRHPRERW